MSEWNLLHIVSGFLLSRCSVVVCNSIFYTIVINPFSRRLIWILFVMPYEFFKIYSEVHE